MVVQNNIPALNSHRNLQINNSGLARNLERLSSGFRINRAADDAAGLAISERMRGQIRGLAMAEQNTSQGINLIQTAEGGLQETQNILQRIRELAVMSSNATFGEGDRQQIHHEVVALIDEMDRIASSTHYNGINLIDGSFGNRAVGDNTNVIGLNLSTLRLVEGALAGMTDLNARVTVTEMNGTDPRTGETVSRNVISLQIGDVTFVGEQAIEMARDIEFTAAAGNMAGGVDAANELAAAINALLGTNLADGTRVDLSAETATVAAPAAALLTAHAQAELARVLADFGDLVNPDGTAIVLAGTTDADLNAFLAAFTHANANNADAATRTAMQNAVNSLNWMSGATLAVDGQWDGATANDDLLQAATAATLINQVLAEHNVRDPHGNPARLATDLADVAAVGNALSDIIQDLGVAANREDAVALFAALNDIAFVTRTPPPAATNSSDVNATFITALEGAILDMPITADNAAALEQLLRDAGVIHSGPEGMTFDTYRDDVGVTFRDNAGNAVATMEFANGTLTNGVISHIALINDAQGHEFAVGTARVAARDDVSSALIFQIGANGGQDQRASLSVRNMNAGSLGFVDAAGIAWTVRQMANSHFINEDGERQRVDEENPGISILTREGANASIDVLDAALDQVSSQRAQLGAMQNRLESTMNSLGVARENLTAAESTIRDVDMAAEMMQFTQNNILTQAAQAMLAQANQLPQGVLQLLR
ncbi:MAG: hypothetical protein FWE32_01380 [Oscillospiraceae bacterium]|nr:hypothetical protein [Oscillospiraceae bacterium]